MLLGGRALPPPSGLLPAPELSLGLVRGALGHPVRPGSDPSERVPAPVQEIMEDVSRVHFFASLFTIWRPAFKLYFYSQRHFGYIYDLQTSPGERCEYPLSPFCSSSSRARAGISPA